MRTLRALIALAAALLASAPAFAQPVTSAGPDSVSVTIYRPEYPDDELDLEWLNGYALVTEKRTITIPRGRATIRFEGVAAGILPESAIVTGMPDGVREKNLDADLLSPRSLYDRSLGRPVTIRRMIGGKQVEERAIIRSSADGAAILQTKDGFIAANCGSIFEDELVYDGVPAGLSAKPTLSIETDAPAERKVTVTLSYLAWGFDWKANYVATMRPDGKSADLFAWVTLANSDVTSFENAETMVVAGKLNREDEREYDRYDREQEFSFSCFSDPMPPSTPMVGMRMGIAAEPSPAPMAYADDGGEEIIVTGSRMVRQEELGDLKLYRVPDRTTIASMSMKQVALLDKPAVPVEVYYRVRIDNDDEGDVTLMLRAQNRKADGLGLPLPAGNVALFEPLGNSRALIGEGKITDKAVNEEVEIEVAEATQVNVMIEDLDYDDNWEDYELVVTNANPFPIHFEAELTTSDGYTRAKTSARLKRKKGKDVWVVEVPANGTVKLRYRLVAPKEDD